MFMLFSFLNIIIGTTFAGTGVIIALVVGPGDVTSVFLGAVAGFALSLPATWGVARKVMSMGAVQRN